MTGADERAAQAGRQVHDVSADVRAPASLRLALATRSQAPRASRWRPALAGSAIAALLVAVILAFTPGSGGRSAPSIADAAAVALRAPQQAPARGPDGALAVSAAGVRFPDYGAHAGWRPVGSRTDSLRGRSTVSVAYDATGARAGYAIVAGAPLPIPAGARRLVYDGIPVAVVRHGDLQIVTWRRGGRTCVVAARGTSLDRLLDLVAQT